MKLDCVQQSFVQQFYLFIFIIIIIITIIIIILMDKYWNYFIFDYQSKHFERYEEVLANFFSSLYFLFIYHFFYQTKYLFQNYHILLGEA